MASIHIHDIEAAINHWRIHGSPADGIGLASPTRALAEVYALMVWHQRQWQEETAMSVDAYTAWLGWYETTTDTPCIAICSTAQGDAICKGCGRTFEEVQHWLHMTPANKREVWHRITLSHDAWRFNRYAERAGHPEMVSTTTHPSA
jgi:uncharacterized protein